MTTDLKTFFESCRSAVNQAMKEYIARFCIDDRMRQPIEYSLMSNGKRIRPVLCLSSCYAITQQTKIAIPAASALEMIHTYSLIHDDLPALDNDALRRGRPTCHLKFNEATAILAGDALLNMAFEVLSEAALDRTQDDMNRWIKVIAFISQASGCRGMIAGQARDMEFEGTLISREELQQMHSLKTGALIQAAVFSGAVIGIASDDQLDRLLNYARNIGLAFQVTDDILNVKGDPGVMGKAIGTDSARQKTTYPSLLGLTASQKFAEALIDQALQALKGFDKYADPLRAIAQSIVDRKR